MRPPVTADGDGYTVTFALRDVDIEQVDDAFPPGDPRQAWRTVGFDLDGFATAAPTSASSCVTPQRGGPVLDGEAGIDNIFGSLVAPALFPPDVNSFACCQQAHGVGTWLLRISDWNGRRDDVQVTVALLVASAGTSTEAAQVVWSSTVRGPVVPSASDAQASYPSWVAGADTYFVGAGQLTATGDLESARGRDVAAYVVGGALVMALDESTPLRFFLDGYHSFTMPLTDGHLVARFAAFTEADAQGAGFVAPTQLVSGLIGGRFLGESLEESILGYFGRDLHSADDCVGARAVVAQLAPQLADLMHDPNLDGTSPAGVCDAFSVGISFRGVRAASVLVAGDGGDLAYFEPACDETQTPPPGLDVPFLGTQCPLGTTPTCAYPVF